MKSHVAEVQELGGKYRIVAELGQGGTARVWLAVSRGPHGFSKLVVLLIPPFVAGMAFASTALGCVIYNWLAGKMGGVEVELDQGGPA